MRLVSMLMLTLLFALAGAQSPAPERLIRSGDKVQAVCEEEPTLNRSYTITQDGFMLVPFAGAIEVRGLTLSGAAKKVADALVGQNILKKATVTLEFTDNELKPVRFSGAVKQPGTIPFRAGLTLQDVVRIAQPTETADLEQVQIEPQTGKSVTIAFAEGPAGSTGNPTLRAGDHVIFPILVRSPDVLLLGGVAKPGSFAYSKSLTVRALIEKAGGFDSLGDPKRVRLERGKDAPVIWDLTVETFDPEVRPADRIVVELLPVRRFVKVTGEVAKPGTVEFREGLTLTQAIKAAGGLKSTARLDRVEVRSDQPKSLPVSYDLEQILKGYMGDIKLKPNDTINVLKGRAPAKKEPIEAPK